MKTGACRRTARGRPAAAHEPRAEGRHDADRYPERRLRRRAGRDPAARLRPGAEDDALHPAQRGRPQTGSCDGSVKAGRGGFTVTPRQLAEFQNAVQALAEAEPLGIPVLFKDNQRNHYNNDPRFGISGGAGAFTEFPREAGMAAAALGTGDMSPVRR
jgi:hypothetical protein